MFKRLTALVIFGSISFAIMNNPTDLYQEYRDEMVSMIVEDVTRTHHYTGIKALSPRVIAAMSTTPRHEFVPTELRQFAYYNRPLAIGHEQTISQPFIVALMTQLLKPQATDKVLEVGTGSGYQAAVLSTLVAEVFSIEIVAELARDASNRLTALHYNNVKVRAGNGYLGWPEQAPFDSIIVTAGGNVPPNLLAQLKKGGRMIIPVNNSPSSQELTLFEKDHQGNIISRKILPVIFVPLIPSDH